MEADIDGRDDDRPGAALIRLPSLALVACVVVGLASPAVGQTQSQEPEIATVEDIVVVARRAGAPMWTVTEGPSILIVVGEIDGLPRDLAWRSEALEAAAARSQRILFPQVRRASFADLGRMIWRARSVVLLPDDGTIADHVPTPDIARLEPLMADEGTLWRRQKLIILAGDLMEQAGYRQGRALDVSDVVRRAGRRADVPMRAVGVIRGDEFVEMMISSPQSQHLRCLQAAIPAAEAGPAAGVARAEDWRALRVAAVLANPLEGAVSRCWPYADPTVGAQISAEWLAAIKTSLSEPGVTMAVAPLRMLAETDGVLDALEAEGADIVGPQWK